MQHEPDSIRIFGPKDPDSGKPKVVGAGILVAADHILTCTHVVTAAQGSPNAPVPDPARPVRFDWPLLPSPPGAPGLLARPVQSRPLLTDPTVADVADITLLRIERPQALPEAARPARLVELSQPYGREAAAYGFHRGQGDVVRLTLLGKVATGAVQIEQRPGYPEVDTGFSGAAVRDTDHWRVVGMLVRRDTREQARTTYMIPAAQLLQVLADAGITQAPVAPAPRPTPVPMPTPAPSSPAPPDQRRLRDETIRLLADRLIGDPGANARLLADAFEHLPNDPTQVLRPDGAPRDLATEWVGRLWEARCMDGHSPLYRLLAEGYKDRREPAVEGFDGLDALLAALDAPCSGSEKGGVPEAYRFVWQGSEGHPLEAPVRPDSASRDATDDKVAGVEGRRAAPRSGPIDVDPSSQGQDTRADLITNEPQPT